MYKSVISPYLSKCLKEKRKKQVVHQLANIDHKNIGKKWIFDSNWIKQVTSIIKSYLLNSTSVTESGIRATKILVTFFECADLISSWHMNKFRKISANLENGSVTHAKRRHGIHDFGKNLWCCNFYFQRSIPKEMLSSQCSLGESYILRKVSSKGGRLITKFQ